MRTRLLVAVFVLAAVQAPPAARAAHASGTCGRDSFRDDGPACTFFVRGLPVVEISGYNTSTTTATVHVWVTIEPTTGTDSPTIIECRATAPKSARCENALSVGQGLDSTKTIVGLHCHVAPSNAVFYKCQSGIGI